jgi:hypothetical protein
MPASLTDTRITFEVATPRPSQTSQSVRFTLHPVGPGSIVSDLLLHLITVSDQHCRQ